MENNVSSFLEGYSREPISTISAVLKILKSSHGELAILSPDFPFSFSRQGRRMVGYYAFSMKHVLRFEAKRKDSTLESVSIWELGDSLSDAPRYIIEISFGGEISAAQAIADAIAARPSITESIETGSKVLAEATADDIKQFINEVGDDGGTLSGAYRKYVKWADEKGMRVVSDITFSDYFKRYRTALAGPGKTSVTITAGVKDDKQTLPVEYDEFEQEILNNSVLYKYEMMAEIVKRIVTWDPLYKNAFIYGSGGIGKEQPHSAKIMTPSGWTTMGEIKAGDLVKTPSGVDTPVTAKFPQGVKPVYEITLRDGSKTRAGAEHLWKTKTDSDQKEIVKKTIEILDDMNTQVEDYGKVKDPYYLPLTQPVQLKKKQLPIPPYALGLLLGDGHLGRFGIGYSSVDTQLLESLASELGATLEPTSGCDYRVITEEKQLNEASGHMRNSLLVKLEELGLLGKLSYDKFIPEEYKYSDIEDRLAILQGLIDTDGYCPNGQTVFSSASCRLAQDVTDIVHSLGGRASQQVATNVTYKYKGEVRKGANSYSVTFTLPISMGPPCRLERKVASYLSQPRQLREWQSIVGIKLVGYEESSCIMLNDEEHLYLTDDFIVTHNTYTVKQVIEAFDSKQAVVTYKGAISGFTGMLQVLWNNREKRVIVFDDNDAVIEVPAALNLLKGAMDSDEPRIISYVRFKKGSPAKKEAGVDIDVSHLREGFIKVYDGGELILEESISTEEVKWYEKASGIRREIDLTEALGVADAENEYDDEEFGKLDADVDPAYGMDADEGVPDQFQFTSRVIFISNLTQVPQPLMDRCISIGLNLTKEQILDLIEDRLEKILPQLSLELKKEVLAFMRKYVHRIDRPLTFRLFQQLCAIQSSGHPEARKMMYLTFRAEGMKMKLR